MLRTCTGPDLWESQVVDLSALISDCINRTETVLTRAARLVDSKVLDLELYSLLT